MFLSSAAGIVTTGYKEFLYYPRSVWVGWIYIVVGGHLSDEGQSPVESWTWHPFVSFPLRA